MSSKTFLIVLVLCISFLISTCGTDRYAGKKREVSSRSGFRTSVPSSDTEAKFRTILNELYRSDWRSWFAAIDPSNPREKSRLESLQYGSCPMPRHRFGPQDSIGPYVFTGKVKPPEALTLNERMLLSRTALPQTTKVNDNERNFNGMKSAIGCDIRTLWSSLEQSYEYSEASSGRPLDILEISTNTPLKRAAWVSWYESNPQQALLSLACMLSPITGKPIRYDAREFSPGNAYFEVIKDDKVIRKLFSGERSSLYNPRCTYTYFRIYGEDGIIGEGIDVSETGPFSGAAAPPSG